MSLSLAISTRLGYAGMWPFMPIYAEENDNNENNNNKTTYSLHTSSHLSSMLNQQNRHNCNQMSSQHRNDCIPRYLQRKDLKLEKKMD